MQKCIDYLTEYRSSWLRQLQTEREELALAVETAIKEATTCLSQGGEPANALAQAVWTLPTEELQVFRYTVNTPDLSLLCQNWAHYHNNLKSLCERFHPVPEEELPQLPSQVPRDFFAAISLKTMELYDFNTHQTTKNPLPTCVRSGYVQVDRNTVLVVGTQVLILDLLTLQSTPLASLLTPRDSVGVALVGDTVFAFGGYDGNPMTVCEKCSVPPTRWTELPPMHFARASFTPCSFQALLYLASTRAYDHRAVESFSPRTENFTVLPVSLPKQLQLGCPSVTFVANGELILLTSSKQMARWTVESEEFRVSATDRECCSGHSPFIVGTVVYIANNAIGGKVEKWSLEADSFV